MSLASTTAAASTIRTSRTRTSRSSTRPRASTSFWPLTGTLSPRLSSLMESLLAIGAGLTLRLVITTIAHQSFKLTGTLIGLWEGVITLHFLKAHPRSSDPYVAFAVRMFVDFIASDGNIARMVLVLIWTGLGMVLADVAPAVWDDTGARRVWRRFRRDVSRLGRLVQQAVPTVAFFPPARTVRFSPSHAPSVITEVEDVDATNTNGPSVFSPSSISTTEQQTPATMTIPPLTAPTTTTQPTRHRSRVPGYFPPDFTDTESDISSVLGRGLPQSSSRAAADPTRTSRRLSMYPSQRDLDTLSDISSRLSAGENEELDDDNLSSHSSQSQSTERGLGLGNISTDLLPIDETTIPDMDVEDETPAAAEITVAAATTAAGALKDKDQGDLTPKGSSHPFLPPTPSDSAWRSRDLPLGSDDREPSFTNRPPSELLPQIPDFLDEPNSEDWEKIQREDYDGGEKAPTPPEKEKERNFGSFIHMEPVPVPKPAPVVPQQQYLQPPGDDEWNFMETPQVDTINPEDLMPDTDTYDHDQHEHEQEQQQRPISQPPPYSANFFDDIYGDPDPTTDDKGHAQGQDQHHEEEHARRAQEEVEAETERIIAEAEEIQRQMLADAEEQRRQTAEEEERKQAEEEVARKKKAEVAERKKKEEVDEAVRVRRRAEEAAGEAERMKVEEAAKAAEAKRRYEQLQTEEFERKQKEERAVLKAAEEEKESKRQQQEEEDEEKERKRVAAAEELEEFERKQKEDEAEKVRKAARKASKAAEKAEKERVRLEAEEAKRLEDEAAEAERVKKEEEEAAAKREEKKAARAAEKEKLRLEVEAEAAAAAVAETKRLAEEAERRRLGEEAEKEKKRLLEEEEEEERAIEARAAAFLAGENARKEEDAKRVAALKQADDDTFARQLKEDEDAAAAKRVKEQAEQEQEQEQLIELADDALVAQLAVEDADKVEENKELKEEDREEDREEDKDADTKTIHPSDDIAPIPLIIPALDLGLTPTRLNAALPPVPTESAAPVDPEVQPTDAKEDEGEQQQQQQHHQEHLEDQDHTDNESVLTELSVVPDKAASRLSRALVWKAQIVEVQRQIDALKEQQQDEEGEAGDVPEKLQRAEKVLRKMQRKEQRRWELNGDVQENMKDADDDKNLLVLEKLSPGDAKARLLDRLEMLMPPGAESLYLDFTCGVVSKGPGKKLKATANTVLNGLGLIRYTGQNNKISTVHVTEEEFAEWLTTYRMLAQHQPAEEEDQWGYA